MSKLRSYCVAQKLDRGWYEFIALPAIDSTDAIKRGRQIALRSGPIDRFRARLGTVPIGFMPPRAKTESDPLQKHT